MIILKLVKNVISAYRAFQKDICVATYFWVQEKSNSTSYNVWLHKTVTFSLNFSNVYRKNYDLLGTYKQLGVFSSLYSTLQSPNLRSKLTFHPTFIQSDSLSVKSFIVFIYLVLHDRLVSWLTWIYTDRWALCTSYIMIKQLLRVWSVATDTIVTHIPLYWALYTRVIRFIETAHSATI